ncbi:hypothetical protein J3R30DRAFT_3430302 [Lentinula aciculospora]|uniref:Protein kinase domain-containing protein n=1 Tax=Lentinula aciculospora TaxID=153920 RepID=A0A9W9ASS2_9AGAR|nr:hypothetical protein J3R30DRAFT_3430302 [Lentinula aciculospora]
MSNSQHTDSANSTVVRRRYLLRRPSPTKKRAAAARATYSTNSDVFHASNSSRDIDIRPVLVPLHQNLRRLPSRVHLAGKHIDIYDASMDTRVGSKRKRVASGSNENAQHGGRSSRGSSRLKRFKSSRQSSETSEDNDLSSMDVDADSLRYPSTRREPITAETDSDVQSEESEDEDVEDEGVEENDDSSDDYLISSAPSRVLSRMRKDNLIRLYALTGLTDDAESFTKSEIVQSIIAARDDVASLPPSSPLGRGGGSSDYSSDDAIVPDEEIAQMPSIRRRVTINEIGREADRRPLKSRSLSMGHLNDGNSSSSSRARRQTSKSTENNVSSSSRRHSSRSSPVSSNSTRLRSSISSPPARHLRSRKPSAPILPSIPSASLLLDPSSLPTPTTLSGSGTTPISALAAFTFTHRKGKSKQVEFDESAQTSRSVKTPPKKSIAAATAPMYVTGSESDLTELEDLEQQIAAQPSPRRLRSKDKQRSNSDFGSGSGVTLDTLDTRRVTPMRNAKRKMKSFKEDSTTEQEDNDEDDEEGELDDVADEDEVDELISTAPASISPVQSANRRTPMRGRLRSRQKVEEDPSDGDDEEEMDEEEMDEGTEEEEEENAENEDDDEATIAVEPRKLRNGKIVGEEDVDMVEEDGDEEAEEDVNEEEEGDEEGENDDAEEAEEESVADDVSIDLDAEEDTDEEVEMEDEDSIDLSTATAKTLVRLRRDDLVKLCESRDLEPTGTKPQLAEALLQWRDNYANDFSCPSSAGTARPPSTIKKRAHRRRPSPNRTRKSSQKTATPPVLLRSERVHLDEPRTPPLSNAGVQNDKPIGEPELELDLGTLGLEDREIPPEKLQKLEKIGSGGFKDVFIGKFKGRRIAISEFRGQLSAMDIKELKLLGGFDHPNIVRFLGVSIPENTRDIPVMIVSELCTNGDLFDYIRNVHPPSLHKVLNIMLDIARGLEYLHLRKPSIIHRDCKSSNILITSKGTAKIADFGLAKVKQSTRSMVRSLVGTVNWQAPELWHAHPKYNHKVDVFSCACVYWEMLQWHSLNKKFPWEGMNEHAIYEIVGAKKQRPSLSGLRKQWCPDIVDLIERMWAQEHQDRPTMSEVVEALEDLVNMY